MNKRVCNFINKNYIMDVLIYIYTIYIYLMYNDHNDGLIHFYNGDKIYKSLYVAIIMNESIVVGINLIRACYNTIMSKIYITYNYLMETDMKAIIKKININSIRYDVNNMNTFNKYILYMMVLLISLIYKILFWTSNDFIINIILLSLTLRPFKTLILNSEYFLRIRRSIDKKINTTMSYILSKIASKAINNLNIICMDVCPNINYYELTPFFDNFHDYKYYIILIIKSIFSHIIVSSFKNSNYSVIKYIFTFIHKYQIEELSYLRNILNNSNDANILTKKDISKIIASREWKKLFSQKSINSILHILKNANSNSHYIDTITNDIMFNILRYFTFWTFLYISQLFSIICDLLIFYKHTIEPNKKTICYRDLLYNLIAYILGIFVIYNYSFNIGSLICVYGHNFINVLINIAKDIELYKIYNKLTLYIITSSLVSILEHNYLHQLILYYYYDRYFDGNFIMLVIYILSSISNFNLYHVLSLCLFFYVLSITLYQNNKQLLFQLNENYIKLCQSNDISSYYSNKLSINNKLLLTHIPNSIINDQLIPIKQHNIIKDHNINNNDFNYIYIAPDLFDKNNDTEYCNNLFDKNYFVIDNTTNNNHIKDYSHTSDFDDNEFVILNNYII